MGKRGSDLQTSFLALSDLISAGLPLRRGEHCTKLVDFAEHGIQIIAWTAVHAPQLKTYHRKASLSPNWSSLSAYCLTAKSSLILDIGVQCN